MRTVTDSTEMSKPLLDLFEQGPRVAGEGYAEDHVEPTTLVGMRARGNQFGIAGTFPIEDITR